MWLGGTLSLLGPTVGALQTDAAAPDGSDVQAAPADLQSASSNTWSLTGTTSGAVAVPDSLTFASQTQIQVVTPSSTTGTDGGDLSSSGTTGLSQDGNLAGLAAAAQHQPPVIQGSAVSGNQQGVGQDGGQVVGNAGQATSGANATSGTAFPPDYSDRITAPVPYGIGSDGRGTAPPTHGQLTTFLGGTNNLANDHTPCSANQGVIQSETAITTSGNTVVIGYNDFRGFYCPGNGFQVSGWAYSTDRGHTFTDGHSLPGGTQWRGDPWLATGPDGTIYMAGLYGNPSLTSIGVLRGTVDPNTGMVNWAGPTVINLGAPDKEAMVVDPNSGTIYISYTTFSGQQGINFIKSTNGGVSFSAPVNVTSGSVQGSQVAVGPNGEVYVCWDIGYPSDSGIGFAYSLDGGQHFTVTTKIESTVTFAISGTDRAPAFPHMAVDLSGGPYTGNIYITWQSASLSGKGDALLTSSSDGGQTWAAPIQINDNGSTGIDWFPTVSVDSNGYVHSFFYDRRDNAGTTITNLYYARSTDGGQTFEPNVRVTDTSTNFRTFSDGTPSWGDYINSAADGPSAIVAYTDGRLGDPDAFFIRVGSR
jgi:hypothetical protein